MKRKCLAVLLAATMVFTMAGCGSKDKEVTGDSSTEVTESVAEDTEETEEETITYLVVKKEKRWSREALFHFSMAIAMVIPFILLTIYAYSSDFQAQGRYILPMILPFMYLITKGMDALLKCLVRKEMIRKWIVRIVEGLYIASAYAVYFFVFLPLYH